MTDQPEPESGYAAGADGYAWWRMRDGVTWRSGIGVRDWGDLADAFGPMTPLLRAVRPHGVPDDAVPFVGWVLPPEPMTCVVGPDGDPARYVVGPNGGRLSLHDDGPHGERALSWHGFPTPPAPEPTLAERLREAAGFVYSEQRMQVDPGLLMEAADALENA